jgi:acetate---CoA ligase (ADP-forming)
MTASTIEKHVKINESHYLDNFFHPESLAVIGVSLKRLNLGQIILSNNHKIGCKARLYGVGRETGDLHGVPVFSDVSELPEVPDVAIIITPAKTVPDVMRACAVKGIKRVVIESGGFSEFSRDNRSLEDEVLAIARENDMRIIGPNCIGTICLDQRLVMPFVFSSGQPKLGPISIVTQSGGVGDTLLKIVKENHIFFNKFVAVGNKLDLDEVDFLDYLIQDESTKAIVMYLEGFSRGRAFFETAMRSTKPIIVYKSNRYPLTAKIAQSHTAALSAGDDVVSAALEQAAVLRVNDEEELMVAAKALKIPPMKGNRIAVLSRSGGHAVITVDACAENGLDLVEFPASYLETIGKIYNTNVIAHQNPLDLGEIFDYTIFTKILEETIALDGVDGIIFNHCYQSSYEAKMSREFLNGVKDLVEKTGHPVAVTLVSDAAEVMDITMNHPYPTFTMPAQSVRALRIYRDHEARVKRRDGRGKPADFPVDAAAIDAIRSRCTAEKRIPLTDEALGVCAASGIQPVTYAVARSADGIGTLDISYPAAVKLLSRDATHKTDVGGVRLNCLTKEEAIAAANEIAKNATGASKKVSIDGFLVQEMSPRGEEFFVGARRDPSFGPVVVAGFGGVFIELFKDRAMRLAPVTHSEAEDMLQELRAYPLLSGYRGRPAMDRRALIDVICRVSCLMNKTDFISEIDLNPVIIHPEGEGVSIVDARVFFQ